MTYLQLEKAIKQPVFALVDVFRSFPDDQERSVLVQLHRFSQRGLIKIIKRGLYCFGDQGVDEFELANRLYRPSYVSLESALNYHGIIPDIPVGGVTSVTTITTKKFSGDFGRFYYQKILPKHFWGYSESSFKMAFPEKALLDYAYIKGKDALVGLRVDWTKLDRKKYLKWQKLYD